jgi:protein-L-isoaspartate(D-aspartate) O-methyltransferase
MNTTEKPDARAEERMRFVLNLRRRGIRDPRVLRALELVPRDAFVEPDQRELAYADQALPISCGQTISQPYVVAAMTEALSVEPQHKVLEIGTGSGYQAAILAHLAQSVVSIERYRTLADTARERLAALGLSNVTVLAGDGTGGAPEHAPFDRIIVTAAAAEVPPALFAQLADGGVLVAPIGAARGVQSLIRFEKHGDKIEQRDFMAVRFVPLLPGQAAAL